MHHSEEQSELITHLFTLFIRCPFGQATTDCPFIDIRALQSLDLKFQLAEKIAMHPQCRENLRDTHGDCYRKRFGQIISKKKHADWNTESNLAASSRGNGTTTKEQPWPSAFSCATSQPLNMPLSR